MKITDRARGKWDAIFKGIGIDGDVLSGRHQGCPKCGGADRFRYVGDARGGYFCGDHRGDGFDLLAHLFDWTFSECARAVEAVIGTEFTEDERTQYQIDQEKAHRQRDWLRRIEREATPIGTEVAGYLRNRGLKPNRHLRQGRMMHREEGRELTVMLGKIAGPDGRPISWHVTFIEDGEKAGTPSRKVLTPIGKGGAIRLGELSAHMGIAEGIESALSVNQLTGLPMFAGVSAGMLRAWTPPPCVRRVSIFGDRDSSFAGQAAAYSLAHRLAPKGIEVEVVLPEMIGDFNDQLMEVQG